MNYTLWDALITWRNYIYKKDLTKITKYNYFTGIIKLIEESILDPYLPLKSLDIVWYEKTYKKIYSVSNWADATKQARKTCLNSFYLFTIGYKPKGEPQKQPPLNEIKFTITSIEERPLTKNIDPDKLLDVSSKINIRDTVIIAVVLYTKKNLEDVLDLKKDSIFSGFILFRDCQINVPKAFTDLLNNYSRKNKTDYLFITEMNRRVHRIQITRTLQSASKRMHLDFKLTPKIILAYSVAYAKDIDTAKLIKNCKSFF